MPSQMHSAGYITKSLSLNPVVVGSWSLGPVCQGSWYLIQEWNQAYGLQGNRDALLNMKQ